MYCSKCGADNKEGSVFCSACGSTLKVNVENSIPVKKKSKKPLIIVIVLLLVALAVAAVILLTPKDATEENAREVYVPESCALYFYNDGFIDGSVKIEFTYNPDGTLKKYVAIYDKDYIDADYSKTETGDLSYDRDERTITLAITQVITETGEIEGSYQYCLRYNDNGQITESDSERTKKVYEYDDRNLTRIFTYYNDRLSTVERFIYENYMDGSRLKYVSEDEYAIMFPGDDPEVVGTQVRNCTYTNDGNTMEVRPSERPDELMAIYNYQTIKCTSEIDMESFMISQFLIFLN